MSEGVRPWLLKGRETVARQWSAAAGQPWADLALALVFTVVGVWLVTHSGSDPADTVRVDIFAKPGADLPPAPPPGLGPAGDQSDQALAVTGTLLATAPLAIRRRLPLAAFVAQFAGILAAGNQNTWVTVLALLIGAYSLAAAGRSAAVSMATLVAAGAVVAFSFDDIELPVPDWAVPFAILLPFGLFGVTVRALRARAAASAERAEAVRASQEAITRAAVAEERARIARELHDVVSHHVSVMVIQAGAAGKVIDSRPDQAREAIAAIADSGREAMGELRHALGILAPAGGGEPDLLRPEPGLDQLEPLIEKVRAAGQPVTVERGPVSLPRGMDVAAYRVVQEGLTNALRYAPGARTTVVVQPDGDALVVEVIDHGADGGSAPAGARTGLLGLAERLRFHGGTLDAGPRLGGGFRVTARLPYPELAGASEAQAGHAPDRPLSSRSGPTGAGGDAAGPAENAGWVPLRQASWQEEGGA